MGEKKIEHEVTYYLSKTSAVLTTKLAEECDVKEYITFIHKREQPNRKKFVITNRYNEQELEIRESTYFTDNYDDIEEAINDIKEANRDALIEREEQG